MVAQKSNLVALLQCCGRRVQLMCWKRIPDIYKSLDFENLKQNIVGAIYPFL